MLSGSRTPPPGEWCQNDHFWIFLAATPIEKGMAKCDTALIHRKYSMFTSVKFHQNPFSCFAAKTHFGLKEEKPPESSHPPPKVFGGYPMSRYVCSLFEGGFISPIF